MNMGKVSSVPSAAYGAERMEHVEKMSQENPSRKPTFFAVCLSVLLAFFVLNHFVLKGNFDFMHGIPLLSEWKLGVSILVLLNVAVLVWRIVLVMMYRPAKACTDEELKTCTVIIPAYNEGSQVLETLRSVMASDFPADKMQVICVDDGSKDDTWQWMLRGHSEFGDRVEIIRSPRNQGKRHALNHGFLRARGEILVTIDSDSEVEVQTIRRMVSAFCRNPRVGAVAGNVRVLNREQGCIPKMMDVIFTYSFDFIRAAQSGFNTVMCTPGALSAYDGQVVAKVRESWLNQQFMGLPANIGEDRAMTNLILKEGRFVHFQSDAVVFTNVPVAYRGLCKMMLRWARSNIRETIALSRFGFTRFRPESVIGAQIDLALQVIGLGLREILKVSLIASIISWPLATMTNLGIGMLVTSLVPALFFLIRHRSWAFIWAFPYSLFMMVGLSWISLYALLTPQKNGWLTREIAATPSMAPSIGSLIENQTFFQEPSSVQNVPSSILMPLENQVVPGNNGIC